MDETDDIAGRSDEMVMQEPARQEALTEARGPSGRVAWALGLLGGPLGLHRWYLRRPARRQLIAPVVATVAWMLGRLLGHGRTWFLGAAAIGGLLWLAELIRLPRELRARHMDAAREAQAVLDRERVEMEQS